MIMSNEEHSQRKLAEDFGVAKDLHTLCSQSAESLLFLGEHTDDPQLSQLLTGTARARHKIAGQLLRVLPKDEAAQCSEKVGEIASRYRLIPGNTEVTDELLLEIAKIDQLALQELRRSFKTIVNLSLACSLSSLLATFQISSDKLSSSLRGTSMRREDNRSKDQTDIKEDKK